MSQKVRSLSCLSLSSQSLPRQYQPPEAERSGEGTSPPRVVAIATDGEKFESSN